MLFNVDDKDLMLTVRSTSRHGENARIQVFSQCDTQCGREDWVWRRRDFLYS